MKRALIPGLMAAVFLGGCFWRDPDGTTEELTENQKILRENEYRIKELESTVTSLNDQLAQLNNRVYEVRTRNGQKTSMTVVPVASSQEIQPIEAPAQKAAPAGRLIDPQAKPTPLPAQKAVQPKAASKPAQPVAKAQGSIGASATGTGAVAQNQPVSDALELPPADLPAPNIPTAPSNELPPVPTGNTTNSDQAIPVPVLPVSDISLPPEHPGLPPMESVEETIAPAPEPAPAPIRNNPPVSASIARNEQSAYDNALKAARSGHLNEGIRLFNEFLQQYPNSRYTANADYWIGECLYAQGKYQDALNMFQTVNNSFPNHHKNADALLKAGLTMSKLGNNAGAQEKYRAILASFPNTEAARRVRAMGVSR